MSPRLTLAETCAEFRKAGISVTNSTLADGIAEGKYPFGRELPTKGKRRNFEIWAKDVHAFLDSLKQPASVPVAIAAVPPAPMPTKALQVIKWATVCSNPLHKEDDCLGCPYRASSLCTDSLLADAAAVLADMTLLASTHGQGVSV